jgi:hypothetical protein
MNKDDLIEHRMFNIQDENSSLLAEFNAQIRGYEEKLSFIAKKQQAKEQECEEMY